MKTNRWTDSIRRILAARADTFPTNGQWCSIGRINIIGIDRRYTTSTTTLTIHTELTGTLSTIITGHTVAFTIIIIIIIVINNIAI